MTLTELHFQGNVAGSNSGGVAVHLGASVILVVAPLKETPGQVLRGGALSATPGAMRMSKAVRLLETELASMVAW